MSEVGNEDAGGVLARLMRGANLRRSVEVLKAPTRVLQRRFRPLRTRRADGF